LIRRIAFTLCLIPPLCLPAFAREPVRTIDAIVNTVSDGDTITIVDSRGTTVKVHLYGVDAPHKEKSKKDGEHIGKPGQPYGKEAWNILAAKINGKRVRVDVMATDRKNNAISVVWLSGRNINMEMVAEGWGWPDRRYLDPAHEPAYVQAENKARSGKLGLWQQSNPQPPWEFRKMQKKRIILNALSFKWFE